MRNVIFAISALALAGCEGVQWHLGSTGYVPPALAQPTYITLPDGATGMTMPGSPMTTFSNGVTCIQTGAFVNCQ